MRLVFRCTQAYVKEEDAAGNCTFYIEPNTAPLVVALGRHTSVVPAPEVVVDDLRDDGGFSYLVPEPKDPEWLALGALYVEWNAWLGLQAQLVAAGFAATADVPSTFAPYELAAVYYSDGSHDGPTTPKPGFARQRYHGFHAEVIDASGPRTRLRVWSAARTHGKPDGVELTIDLNDPAICDATAGGVWDPPWARITTGSATGAAGALFLNTDFLASAAGSVMLIPKRPPSLGADSLDQPPLETGREVPDGSTAVLEGQPGPARPALTPCAVCELVTHRHARAIHKVEQLRPHGPIILGERDGRTVDVINVSGTGAWGELAVIQEQVRGGGRLALVDDADGLLALLRQLVACRPPRARRRLDLIGHTNSAGLVMLGTSVIDFAMDQAAREARPEYRAFATIAREGLLRRLGIGEVRLIGCRSAGTSAARETMQVIEALLRVDVRAVCDLVTATEFDAHGFVGTTVATASPTCPVFKFPDGDVTFAPDQLSYERPSRAPRVIQLSDLESAMRVVAAAIGEHRGARMPGLLSQPVVQVVLGKRRPWPSFEILLGLELVRTFPDHERSPVVFPVKDRALLRQLFG